MKIEMKRFNKVRGTLICSLEREFSTQEEMIRFYEEQKADWDVIDLQFEKKKEVVLELDKAH